MRRVRDGLGVKVAALSASLTTPVGAPGDALTDSYDKILADCRALGTSILRIGCCASRLGRPR